MCKLPNGTVTPPTLFVNQSNVIGFYDEEFRVYEVTRGLLCPSFNVKLEVPIIGWGVEAWGYANGAFFASIRCENSLEKIVVQFSQGRRRDELIHTNDSPVFFRGFAAECSECERYAGFFAYTNYEEGRAYLYASEKERNVDDVIGDFKVDAPYTGVPSRDGKTAIFAIPYNGEITLYELSVSDDPYVRTIGSIPAKKSSDLREPLGTMPVYGVQLVEDDLIVIVSHERLYLTRLHPIKYEELRFEANGRIVALPVVIGSGWVAVTLLTNAITPVCTSVLP